MTVRVSRKIKTRMEWENDMDWALVAPPQAKGRVFNGSVMLMEKTSRGSWDLASRGEVGWTCGAHTWEVRLLRGAAGVSVGISRENVSFSDANKNVHKRCDLFCGSGEVVDLNDEVHPFFRRPIQDGSTIKVYLDLYERVLAYSVNGSPLVVAFANLEPGPWYPYFCMMSQGCAIAILTDTSCRFPPKKKL